MIKSKIIFTTVAFIFLLSLYTVTGTVFAETGKEVKKNEVAEVLMGSAGLSWNPHIQYGELVLTVSRPDGHVITRTFASGVVPGFDLSDMDGLPILNGSYTYQLVVIPGEKANASDREKGNFTVNKSGNLFSRSITQTGYFTVKNGSIVPDIQEPEYSQAQQDGISGTKDQVILDDLIVDGSICAGQDCVNGESFGFDTIRLKENNLRIRAVDTSSTSSFPSRDWQITFNDSANGGANKFSIDDIDGGRTPFTIEAGAPSHSLYVDDGGRLGLGTSTPVVDVHVKTGNTPTLRLEQDGSSGFTPQTWDLAGNEANFFIRDATNGSTLPFRIQPGAPSSVLSIMSDGKVGQGTWGPSYRFHQLTDSSTNAQFVAERSGGAKTIMAGTAGLGYFGTLSNHNLRFSANDQQVMDLMVPGGSNDLEMANNAVCTSTGVWQSVSSREAKENIVNLSTKDAIDTLANLQPVTFNYKKDKEDPYVGFIAEDVPDLVATKTRKRLVSMDIVAVLTKVLQEQQNTLKTQQAAVQNQQQIIEAMKQKMAELEKQLQNK
jgi:Chaperone of endosialidase